MQMTEKIIQSIQQEMPVKMEEIAPLQALIAAVQQGVDELRLQMSPERWLRLGLHLVAVIRRALAQEQLDPIDAFIAEQVPADVQQFSRAVLAASSATAMLQDNLTEVVLLAVHFAAAQESV